MQSQQQITQALVQSVQRDEEIAVLQPPAIGQTERQNELLMFIKPEILAVDGQDNLRNSLNLIWRKLDQFNADVAGIVLVAGKALERKESMDRHYGAINVLSKTASTGLNADDRQSVYEALAVSPAEYPSTVDTNSSPRIPLSRRRVSIRYGLQKSRRRFAADSTCRPMRRRAKTSSS